VTVLLLSQGHFHVAAGDLWQVTIIYSSKKGLTVEETIAEIYSDPFSYISDTEWRG
jgi:hypothetical protein